jgi:hypothetical protein
MDDSDIELCEDVFNPLMHNMRDMARLVNRLRNAQDVSCNNIECFTDNSSNPLVASQPFYASYLFLFLGWFVFAALLVFMRPKGLMKQKKHAKNLPPSDSHGPNRDDHGNSSVSF